MTASYKYDADGSRTQKTINGVTTDYTLEGSTVIRESNGTDTIWYNYDSNGSLVSFDLNGTMYYYIKNQQGDIIAIADSAGAKVVEYTYDSWGKLISTSGSLASTVGIKNPYRYREYRYDTETGLYYLQNRYYDPEMKRFINADVFSALTHEQGSEIQYNLFSYCLNNPVNYSDAEGLFALAVSTGISATAIAVLESVILALVATVFTIIICEYIRKNAPNIQRVFNKIKTQAISAGNRLRRSLIRAAKKALAKIGFNKIVRHHIVAKTAWRAKKGRSILANAKIGINSSQNLVSIKAGFHFFLHTSAYYYAVNDLLAQSVAGVKKGTTRYISRVSSTLYIIKKGVTIINNNIYL